MRNQIIKSIAFAAGFFLFTTITNAVPISPDKYYIETSTDISSEYELKIFGREQLASSRTVYFRVVGMKKIGEFNEREFYYADSTETHEAANWIQLEETSLLVEPGKESILKWKLLPNSAAECGTNLAGILVTNDPNAADDITSSTEVAVENQIISQIHINVSQTNGIPCPDNSSDNILMEFFAGQKIPYINKTLPVFNYDNINFTTRIENRGNLITRSPKGFIELFGLGDKITIPFNEESLDIYPKTTRNFSTLWVDPNYPREGSFIDKLTYELGHLRLGRYEARLGITKNVDPHIIESIHIWIIPWRVLSVILAIVVAALVINKLAKRK